MLVMLLVVFVTLLLCFMLCWLLDSGYDNGLTLDDTLVAKKRSIETSMNRIPDKRHAVCFVLMFVKQNNYHNYKLVPFAI